MIRFYLCCFFFIAMLCHRPLSAVAQRVQQTGYSFKKPSADGTGKFYMNREIARVMGAAGAGWLERNNRQQEENTAMAISKLPLSDTASVADIGAGTGYYTFRIATKLPKGKVTAVEIQDELINYLNDRKNQLQASNVRIVQGDSVSPNLPEHSIDLAIMVDVYHELLYPQEMLGNIRKALKHNGKLLLLEYRAEDPAVAIKPLHKMNVAQVNREMQANGFVPSYRGNFLPIQHFLIYQKVD